MLSISERKEHLQIKYCKSIQIKNLKSSSSQMFFNIGVMKNVAKFTGKHLCWSLFLIKLQACEYCKKFYNIFYGTHLVAAFEICYLKYCSTMKTNIFLFR